MFIDFRPSSLLAGALALGLGYSNLTGINVPLHTKHYYQQAKAKIIQPLIAKSPLKFKNVIRVGEAHLTNSQITCNQEPCSDQTTPPVNNYEDLPGVTLRTKTSETKK